MSTDFSLKHGGEIPLSPKDPVALGRFKSMISVIRTMFPTTDFTREHYLNELMRATNIDEIFSALTPFRDPTVPMDNYMHILPAINCMLSIVGNRAFPSLIEFTVDDETKPDAILVITFVQPIVNDDNESIHADVPVASIEELTDDLSKAEEEFEKIQSGDEKPDETVVRETIPVDGTWIKPKTSVRMTPKDMSKTSSEEATDKRKNQFSGLGIDDDDEDEAVFSSTDGMLMQQSYDETMAQYLESPIDIKKAKRTQFEILVNKRDMKVREKGWQAINRIVEQGDTSNLSLDDLCFYVCHAGKTLQQSKRDHVRDFQEQLTSKSKKMASSFQSTCDKMVDTSTSLLSKEDASIFNKIRTTQSQLDEVITKGKQIKSDIQLMISSSNALLNELHVQNSTTMLATRSVNIVTLTEKINYLGQQLTKQDEMVAKLSKTTQSTDLISLTSKVDALNQKMQQHDANNSDFIAMDKRLKAQEKKISTLLAAAVRPPPPVVNKTTTTDTLFPDAVLSRSHHPASTPKKNTDLPTPTVDVNTDKQSDCHLAHEPFVCMSRVLIRHPLMGIMTGWVMSYVIREKDYLYHITTNKNTDIFVTHANVVAVEELGPRNQHPYGYDPSRNLDIFLKATPSSHTTQSVNGTPSRSYGHPSTPATPSRSASKTSRRGDVDDDDSVLSDGAGYGRHVRKLADNEYVYPEGTLAKKVREDKIEELHDSLSTSITGTATIQAFYSDLRRKLKPENIPLHDWSSLAPGVNLLDLPTDCKNYSSARTVMSRGIYNLLETHKSELIPDAFLSGELMTYHEDSDGLAFLAFIVAQIHPRFSHEVVLPDIASTLRIPTFDDNMTIYQFCANVKDYKDTWAPAHFTPMAAAQYVLESLRSDSRFVTGCAYLENEVLKNKDNTGYAPPHLQLTMLPRAILQRYDEATRRELAKPRRSGLTVNMNRLEHNQEQPMYTHFPEDNIVLNRMGTRSQTQHSRGGPSSFRSTKPGRGHADSYQRRNPREQHRNYDRNGVQHRSDNSSQRTDAKVPDIAFTQCLACGKPGHEDCDCRQKGTFVKLSAWFNMLTPQQRGDISAQMDKDARATHERYKRAYANRRQVRSRLNRIEIDSQHGATFDLNDERNWTITACRANMADMDFGSLDPMLVDDDEPCLDFNPDTDSGDTSEM